ncbi:2-C-methyl-D-erythritol 4-phosphate cytidylyltransferase [Rhodocaloribacter litoris]|uniref:2-C-methyl-D-erythritol 4-phosphate cytidylyltransferase n=1 Tax=Rhodocaloribacter litoris TaxID=2558931 RepID=UPI001424A3F9|nr:2-C-methyl-D-erythritol 4-phosphate cytidylyltransferase [Rhodocaloribacter litoris]QXD15163.1 2-C-methyl-D-erythritol 4-phosphate cytidylyltransferase [Rhodocaloribacter litoris]GIV60473.1 MAG: 2-C-methyl-D-erythritol 4-phosphate cytidylyltransferase [Rhodothermaceae bacterium]
MSNREDSTRLFSTAHAGPVAVLVPAAGTGRRMGGPRKQFRQLGGRPLLVQTLLVFERHPEVDRIVVAVPPGAVVSLEATLRGAGVHKLQAVVPGGGTRQASVGAALQALPDDVAIVLVHDAVRPFVRREDVSRVLDHVRRHGAAALALPVSDTLRYGLEGFFGETVPREGLFRMQTPQGFRRDWFEEAHAAARRDGVQATDDVELVQRLGHAVAIVPGSEQNVKLTTAGDWEWARRFWPQWAAEIPEEAAGR